MKWIASCLVLVFGLALGEAQTVKTLPTYTRNPLTGNSVVKGGAYNPYTGASVQYRQSYNAMTGINRGSVGGYNPYTGAASRASRMHNPMTGATTTRYTRRY